VELRQLRYFAAVVEEGGFSRAARRLHISQPPLSTQMKSLEDELGVRLLERTNRGVTPTAAGAIFYDEATAVLARLELAKTRARHAGRGDAGQLTIGFVSIADFGVLPPALKEFRSRFPAVEVQLHELTTDAQIPQIRAARLDLGIGLGPVDDAELDFETVLSEELVLAAPTGALLAKGEGAADLKRFSRESFIVPPREVAPGLYDLVMRQCLASGFAPRITQHARQMQTVIGLVASGMGFALVPESVRNLRRPGVRYRRLLGKRALIDLGLLRLRGTNNPIADHFVRTLKSVAQAAR